MHPREPIFPVHRHRVTKIRENEKTEHCQHFQRQKFGSKRRKDCEISDHQSLVGSLILSHKREQFGFQTVKLSKHYS